MTKQQEKVLDTVKSLLGEHFDNAFFVVQIGDNPYEYQCIGNPYAVEAIVERCYHGFSECEEEAEDEDAPYEDSE